MTEHDNTRRFEQLVLPHLDAAYNLARWLTRNPADAEDVVQEAALRAFKYLSGLRGENARPWLLSIVRQTCYTWLRNNRPPAEVQMLEGDDFDLVMATVGDDGGTPETLVSRIEDRALVNRLIAGLPVPLREVIVLRELEELAYHDIADIVAVPIGTVMSRLSRARAHLRADLARQLDTAPLIGETGHGL